MNYNDERVGKFLNENRVIRVDEVAKCKNLIEKYLEWEQEQVKKLNIVDVSKSFTDEEIEIQAKKALFGFGKGRQYDDDYWTGYQHGAKWILNTVIN